MGPALRLVALSSLLAFASCSTAPRFTDGEASQSTSSSPPRATNAGSDACPVTKPGTGPEDVPPEWFFGWSSSYGNGDLWVGGLWPGGVIVAGPEFVRPDGSIGMKFGWWRRTHGDLSITGRRLDAAGQPLQGEVPEGYGGTGFQASAVIFPTEGCWEVTGRVGSISLTFVTFVAREAESASVPPSVAPSEQWKPWLAAPLTLDELRQADDGAVTRQIALHPETPQAQYVRFMLSEKSGLARPDGVTERNLLIYAMEWCQHTQAAIERLRQRTESPARLLTPPPVPADWLAWPEQTRDNLRESNFAHTARGFAARLICPS